MASRQRNGVTFYLEPFPPGSGSMRCPLELPPTGTNEADRQRHLTAHSPRTMPSGDMQRQRMNAHKFTNSGLQNRRMHEGMSQYSRL